MGQRTIHLLDSHLGSLVCAILTLVRRFLDRVRRPNTPGPPRKVLFLKLIEQGASVLACDALQAARDRVGRENLYFLVFAENRFILDILDVVPAGNVLVVRSERLSWFLVDVVRALVRLRREGVDAVVDMEFFSRASAILAYLCGATRRVGMHRFQDEAPYRGDLLTHRLRHNPYLHVAQAYRLLVEALWSDTAETPMMKVPPMEPSALPRLELGEDERVVLRQSLRSAGLQLSGPLVLLNPSPMDRLPLRRWPLERFGDLGRRLLEARPDIEIALTGIPEERAALESMARELGPRAVSLAGRTSLRDVLVLYTLGDVLVTSDGGPGHFSALTPIDAIVLFGPETPHVFGPLGPRVQSLFAGLACSPCVNVYNHRFSACRRNACLEAIPVDAVLSRVLSSLARRAAVGTGDHKVAAVATR